MSIDTSFLHEGSESFQPQPGGVLATEVTVIITKRWAKCTVHKSDYHGWSWMMMVDDGWWCLPVVIEVRWCLSMIRFDHHMNKVGDHCWWWMCEWLLITIINHNWQLIQYHCSSLSWLVQPSLKSSWINHDRLITMIIMVDDYHGWQPLLRGTVMSLNHGYWWWLTMVDNTGWWWFTIDHTAIWWLIKKLVVY